MYNDSFNFDSNISRNKKNKNNTNIKMIIVIVGAIALGLLVYFITKAIFTPKTNNKPKEPTENKVELSIKNEIVTNAYSYISYKGNIDNDLFIKNPIIKKSNFSNYDKFYYIIQFITEDDLKEKKDNDTNTLYYSISIDKIDSYMKKFFGTNIDYDKNVIIPVTFPFKKNNFNTGTLEYDKTNKEYKVLLNTNSNIFKSTNYITDLSSATKTADNKLIIKEKIIFIDLKEVNSKYDYAIYKDYNHTLLIDKQEGISKEEVEKDKLFEKYSDELTTITYTFNKSGDNYYFNSSKIDTK